MVDKGPTAPKLPTAHKPSVKATPPAPLASQEQDVVHYAQ